MEYMELLNKIIEAERVAQQIASEAKAERDNLPNDLRVQREELHTSYLSRAEHRVQTVRDQEKAMADQQIEQLDASLASDLKKIESYFAERHDDMVDGLFKLVVGEC